MVGIKSLLIIFEDCLDLFWRYYLESSCAREGTLKKKKIYIKRILLIETFFSSYESERVKVKEETNKILGEDIALFKKILNELVNAWFTIFYFEKEDENFTFRPEQWIMKILTLNKIIGTSMGIYQTNLEGKYTEATALLRSIIEDVECLIFFHLFPNKIEKWMNNRITMKKVVCLIDDEIKKTSESSIKKLLARPYFRLCKYVHPSKLALRDYIVIENKEIKGLKLYPIFDEETSKNNLLSLSLLMGSILIMLSQLFPEEIKYYGTDLEIEKITDELRDRIAKK